MTFSIKTPHAAVKIWNYVDRMAGSGALPEYNNQIKEEIVSTVSLMSVQTQKSKGNPVGTFNFTLAPNRNWVSVITPGSWCVILMSNEPITKDALQIADPTYVKMFGRIDSVRVEVSVDDSGTRSTRYLVSGQDWGCLFNNILYADPLIIDPLDSSKRMGNAFFVWAAKHLLSRNNTPLLLSIPFNLRALLTVMGESFETPDITRQVKSTHRVLIPDEALNYFKFLDESQKTATSTDIMNIVALQTGALSAGEGEYITNVRDGSGMLDLMSLLGQNTLWSLLMDNSNHALNELYTDLRWFKDRPQLTLYNRIKPFSFQSRYKAPKDVDSTLRALFQNVITHRLEDITITSVNAGTNWRDKFNFIEIKPALTGFEIFDNAVKLKAQAYQQLPDSTRAETTVYDREGFRPLIYSIKQMPLRVGADTTDGFDDTLLSNWSQLLKEWFFDTHRLLNGTITMTGSSHYIPVGDNILFDAQLIGISTNYNSAAVNKSRCFVLGHVENISHMFSVDAAGARHFETQIQFVRGIIVDENKQLIGEGVIDALSTDLQYADSVNSVTTISSSTPDAPPETI